MTYLLHVIDMTCFLFLFCMTFIGFVCASNMRTTIRFGKKWLKLPKHCEDSSEDFMDTTFDLIQISRQMSNAVETQASSPETKCQLDCDTTNKAPSHHFQLILCHPRGGETLYFRQTLSTSDDSLSLYFSMNSGTLWGALHLC